MSETDSSIDFDEEDQSEQEEREVFSELSDQEEDDDEQPVELQNTKTEIFETKDAKRRRKRNRKISTAPDDQVFDKAKQDRLKREKLDNDNLLLVTEFSESESDSNDEISEVQNSKQVIIRQLKTTENVNKTSENAFRFAQSALNGGSKFHRISLSSFRSKKKKGPALEFSSKKSKTNI